MVSSANRVDILGRGWAFPISFTVSRGSVQEIQSFSYSESVQNIKDSIDHILSTKRGSRIGRRDFGSLMYELVQEVNDETFDTLAEHYVREALLKWEKRIILGPTQVNRSKWKQGVVEITIRFRVIKTQEAGSMVYPFYVEEGRRAG